MSFQIHALSPQPFAKYFDYTAEQLSACGAQLHRVTEYPGTPCRVSLADAQVGETVLLLNYEHQPHKSPYRASHAVFVRKGVEQAMPAINTVPEVLSSRLLSIRGFDETHIMRDADVVSGSTVGQAIEVMFASQKIKYIHIHNAKPGCFASKVTRA